MLIVTDSTLTPENMKYSGKFQAELYFSKKTFSLFLQQFKQITKLYNVNIQIVS